MEDFEQNFGQNHEHNLGLISLRLICLGDELQRL